MKKYLLTGLFCLLLPLCCCAQSVQVLTLDSCLESARKHNADIVRSRLDIDYAKAVKRQVFTKYFPQVSGNFIAYHALHDLVSLTPEALSTSSGNEDLGDLLQKVLDIYNKDHGTNEKEVGMMLHGLTVGATAIQPLFAGGRIVNGNRLAKVGVEAAELQAEVTERDVLEDIESDFYLVVGLERKVHTIESALALLDSIDKTARIAYEAGVVTRADLLQVTLKRNELTALNQQLSSGIVLARKLLCQKAGIAYSDSLRFVDEADETEALTRSTGGGFVRPEMQLLHLSVRAEQLQKKMTIGETLPQLAFGATYNYGDFTTNGNLFEHSFYRGNGILFATAVVPLSAWWETGYKIKQHNIRIRQAEIQQEHLSAMMGIQEEKAYSDWQQAAALLRSDSAALQIAEENYRLSLLNYEAGTQTLNDLLQANTLLLQAQNAITDRHITLVEARRRYRDLTGR